jgi:hypothetical protein
VNVADKLVGVLLEDANWEFASRLDLGIGTDITGAPEDWALHSGSAEIKWKLDFDVRSFGVKEILPVLLSIDARMLFDDYSKPDESEQEMQIVYSAEQPDRPHNEADPKAMADFYQAFTAEAQWNPARQADHTHIYPTSIEIDLAKHHIVVHFG